MDSPYRIEIVQAEQLQSTLNQLHNDYFRVRQVFQRPAPPYDFTIFAEFESTRAAAAEVEKISAMLLRGDSAARVARELDVHVSKVFRVRRKLG